MIFKIDGVDITPYILESQLQWTRNDVDGPNADRALDGTMYRDRVAIKAKWTVPCVPLAGPDAAKLLTLIEPEYITVECTDPSKNKVRKFQAYSNNVPATHMITEDGVDKWSGISFPLIER